MGLIQLNLGDGIEDLAATSPVSKPVRRLREAATPGLLFGMDPE